MNANTYHFEQLRLHIAPQTRVSSVSNTPGFASLDDCLVFCKSIGFAFTIVFFNEQGKRLVVHVER